MADGDEKADAIDRSLDKLSATVDDATGRTLDGAERGLDRFERTKVGGVVGGAVESTERMVSAIEDRFENSALLKKANAAADASTDKAIQGLDKVADTRLGGKALDASFRAEDALKRTSDKFRKSWLGRKLNRL